MGPKAKPAVVADTGEIKTLTLKVVGGESPSNAVLASRLSPFGCNPKKSGEEIVVNTLMIKIDKLNSSVTAKDIESAEKKIVKAATEKKAAVKKTTAKEPKAKTSTGVKKTAGVRKTGVA